MKYKNLWDLIIRAEDDTRYGSNKDIPEYTKELSKGSRYDMQELSLSADKNGWVITIFGVGSDEDSTEIFIPSNKKEPITVSEKKVKVVTEVQTISTHDNILCKEC